MQEKQIRVAGVVHDSIVDGPGLRMSIFCQGCPHGCQGCHNPATWPAAGGEIRTAESLLSEAIADPLLTGVTLSGGEPFQQAEALIPLARGIKEKKLSLAAYTGWRTEEILLRENPFEMELLSLLDALVDGQFMLAEKTLELPFRGSGNQRIILPDATIAMGEAVSMPHGFGWYGDGDY